MKPRLLLRTTEARPGSSSPGARPKHTNEGAKFVLSKAISQSLASSEVGQAQGSWGLAHWTHLLGLHPDVDDGEVQSERQRAKDRAEATSRSQESSELKVQEGEDY